jgi:hypothetical protein
MKLSYRNLGGKREAGTYVKNRLDLNATGLVPVAGSELGSEFSNSMK